MSALKKLQNVLIVTKSMRFDRLAGLNRSLQAKQSNEKFNQADLDKLEQKKCEHEEISRAFESIMGSHTDFNIQCAKEVDVTP